MICESAALNRDLWMELDKQLASRTVQWHWVRGLAEDACNMRCDSGKPSG